MKEINQLTLEDAAVQERLGARDADMLATTRSWSAINTGSYNLAGLKALAPILADAFSRLDAEISLTEARPFQTVSHDGEQKTVETGPIIQATARPSAPVQIILTGHYDTVFPAGTFETIRDLGDGRINGPGLADMKGGLCVMLEALQAFEAGPSKDRLGYRVVLTPDEEIGNLGSAAAIESAARDGAHIGMTFEPAMDTGAMSGGRKGSAVYDAVFRGIAAHAGRSKADGRSAIEAAALFTARIESLNNVRAGVTFNVGAIDGGGPVNIVPDLAIVRFGARAPDAETAGWADAQIRQILDDLSCRDGIRGHLHGGFYRPPKPRNRAQEALFKAVQETGEAMGLSLSFEDTGGVCEGNNVFAAGVPNVDTLGVRGGRIHSVEEYVVAESFSERATLSALLLNRLADGRLDARRIKGLMER